MSTLCTDDDSEDDVPAPRAEKVKSSKTVSVARSLLGKNQIVRATLAYAKSSGINKASTTAGVITVNAADFADYSTYADLYDEVLPLKLDIHVLANMSGTGPTTSVGYSAAYSPISASTPGSYLELIATKYTLGPRYLALNYGGSYNDTGKNYAGSQWPAPHTPTGMWLIRVHDLVPSRERGLNARPSANLGALTNFTPGMWARSALTSLSFGYLKFYFNNPAATNDGEIVFHIVMEAAFRIREH